MSAPGDTTPFALIVHLAVDPDGVMLTEGEVDIVVQLASKPARIMPKPVTKGFIFMQPSSETTKDL